MSAVAERLSELKRTNIPRASLARVGMNIEARDGATLSDICEAEMLRRAVEAHLRHFAWYTEADVLRARGLEPTGEELERRVVCVGCMTRGWFSWGIAYGSGFCGHPECSWPGTMYHRILDPDPEGACRRCEQPRSAHEERDQPVMRLTPTGSEPDVRRVLVCPGQGDATFNEFQAVEVLRFDYLLWAHPYEVKIGA